jgi:hypothetical protein
MGICSLGARGGEATLAKNPLAAGGMLFLHFDHGKRVFSALSSLWLCGFKQQSKAEKCTDNISI